MNKAYIFLIFAILFSSFALAEPEFYFKANADVNLKVPCANDGATCSAAATCNITIDDPNNVNLVNNQLMTNNIAYHNYTLTDTTELGEYKAIVYCTDNNESAFTAFTFSTTENGNFQNDLTFIIALAVIIIFCIVIAINLSPDFVWLKALLLVFSLIYTFLIPAFFVIKNTKLIFYRTFTGMLITFVVFVIIWLIMWALKKFEVYTHD